MSTPSGCSTWKKGRNDEGGVGWLIGGLVYQPKAKKWLILYVKSIT
jgi:hypothetical protein